MVSQKCSKASKGGPEIKVKIKVKTKSPEAAKNAIKKLVK